MKPSLGLLSCYTGVVGDYFPRYKLSRIDAKHYLPSSDQRQNRFMIHFYMNAKDRVEPSAISSYFFAYCIVKVM